MTGRWRALGVGEHGREICQDLEFVRPRAPGQSTRMLNRGGINMDNLLLKVPEAAQRLGISRAKLYELIADGQLPSVKIGGCRRIRSQDLVTYVNDLSTAS
jgi:excisionase family DNA binding protein